MKTNALFTIFLTLTLSFSTTSINAQILNSSFEVSNDSLPKNPKNWSFINTEAVTFSLTSQTKISGNKSFHVNTSNDTSSKSHYFSQSIPFQGKKLQRVILSYYIKSDLEGIAGVWWQARDKDDNQIRFTNSGLQNQQVTGKSEWTIRSLLLTLNETCNQFILGGYIQGKGNVWYDSFNVKEVVLADTKPSEDVTAYLNEFKRVVKENSLYADSLNWKQIDKDLQYLSKGINSIDHIAAPKNYILNMLRKVGDNHSFISPKVSFEKSQKTQTSTSVPYSKLLNKHIGYINVPDFSSRNKDIQIKFATKIQELIKTLDTEHLIKSWVVDLRDNRGGNMHPMLAGLGPLTEEGISGNFVSHKDKSTISWFYKNGGFGVGNNVTTQVKKPYRLQKPLPKIAVLIGPNTGSSGEMTAVAFIGKENTQLFGQVSAGYTTTNQDYKLPNGDRVYLASGYVSDRNNTLYLKNLQPDISVTEDIKGKDKTLQVAIDWLEKD